MNLHVSIVENKNEAGPLFYFSLVQISYILVSYLMAAFDYQRLACECLVSKFPRLLSVSSSVQDNNNPDPDAFKHHM